MRSCGLRVSRFAFGVGESFFGALIEEVQSRDH